MLNKTFRSGPLDILTKGTNFFHNLGRRILVYIGAIFVTSAVTGASGLDTTATTMCTFFGLICLFPRDMSKQFTWVFPTLCGVYQCILTYSLGAPLPVAIFLGGCQTWLQRVFMRYGKMGWEWSILIFLLASLSGLTSQGLIDVREIVTFSVSIAICLLAQTIYYRLKLDPNCRRDLKRISPLLMKLCEKKVFKEDLNKACVELNSTADKFIALPSSFGLKEAILVDELDNVSTKLVQLASIDKVYYTDEQNRLANVAVLNINHSILLRIKKVAPHILQSSSKNGKGDFANDTFLFFTKLKYDLSEKVKFVNNEEIRSSIGSITQSVEGILKCMKEDPLDIPEGERFLNRYLKSAAFLTDEYIKLSLVPSDNGGQRDRSIEESSATFKKLETAFIQQHTRLYQNDALQYSTEMKVVDKMLKMDGHGKD